MPSPRLAPLALAAALAACGDRAPPAPPAPTPPTVATGGQPVAAPADLAAQPTPSPAAPPAPGGAPTAAPAAPAAPRPAIAVVREAVALEPSGAVLPLAHDAETVVDPAARFRVTLSVPSADARLQLIDPKDAVVPAQGAHEVGAATELTLTPTGPLTPGTRYTLRLDGAATRELHAAGGDTFTPSSLTVLVAGTPPPAEAKKQAAKRKRR